MDGNLCGLPGAECYVEVKATSNAGSSPFFITQREWELARELSSVGHASTATGPEGTPRRYVIVRVGQALDNPHIHAVRRGRKGARTFALPMLHLPLQLLVMSR